MAYPLSNLLSHGQCCNRLKTTEKFHSRDASTLAAPRIYTQHVFQQTDLGYRRVQQLLDSGYRVRGTARGGKIDFLRGFYKAYPNFETVQTDDVATGDFTDALEGVDAVLHLAWPLAGKEDPADKIESAVEGTLNILCQGATKGVKKFVVTSSWVTVLNPAMEEIYQGLTLTEQDWGKASREDLLTPGRNGLEIYCGAKILAEQAAWQFHEEHPELDIAIICPPFVYGPPILPLPKASLGSPGIIYKLIVGERGRPLPSQLLPFHVDVRDLARADIRALELPQVPAGADRQQKRFLIVSPDVVTWDVAVKHLYDTRPALRNRLPTLENEPVLPGPLSKNDTTRAKEILGITEYIRWQKTFENAIDALLEAEDHWV